MSMDQHGSAGTKFWFFVCVEVELGAVNIDANLRVGCAVNLREWVLAFTRLAFGDDDGFIDT